MELLGLRVRKGKLGEIAYAGINALIPVVLLLLIHGFDSIYPALALVFLSKWRILSLRPRFWWINIKANSVDLLVGMSVVGLLYLSMTSLILQLVIVLLYGFWMLYLKHRSGISSIHWQAGIAQFFALTVLFSLSTTVNDFLIVLGCWVIGYSVARHVTSAYDENSVELLSGLWGLLTAQFGWILYYWTTAYDLSLPIMIPQIALVMLVLSYAATRLYSAAKKDQLSVALVRLTSIYSILLMLVILLFSHWSVVI
ncbi:MAG: hypothetical protein PVI21_04740 [Candidatus Woesebacteria bacterium]|jgi:hypothetical protein